MMVYICTVQYRQYYIIVVCSSKLPYLYCRLNVESHYANSVSLYIPTCISIAKIAHNMNQSMDALPIQQFSYNIITSTISNYINFIVDLLVQFHYVNENLVTQQSYMQVLTMSTEVGTDSMFIFIQLCILATPIIISALSLPLLSVQYKL